MKIKDVEILAGITKKNIRFYEDQGLLSPKRNTENGYRDYDDDDVRILKQIKVFRKLGIPIEEIRQMLHGNHTIADGMRRHLVTLERDRRNLDQSILVCLELRTMDLPAANLDADELLERMQEMESNGTLFQNKQTQDVRIQYVAPAVVTGIVILLLVTLSSVLIWEYASSPEELPFLFVLLMIAILFFIAAGTVLAFIQRIREIGKGEINDAKYY